MVVCVVGAGVVVVGVVAAGGMVFFVVDEVALLNAVLCTFTAIKIYFDIKLCDIPTYTVDRNKTLAKSAQPKKTTYMSQVTESLYYIMLYPVHIALIVFIV